MEAGDVIVCDQMPCGCWPKGVITEKHPGRDDVTRVVTVETAAGVHRRPIVKLAKLDIRPDTSTD